MKCRYETGHNGDCQDFILIPGVGDEERYRRKYEVPYARPWDLTVWDRIRLHFRPDDTGRARNDTPRGDAAIPMWHESDFSSVTEGEMDDVGVQALRVCRRIFAHADWAAPGNQAACVAAWKDLVGLGILTAAELRRLVPATATVPA